MQQYQLLMVIAWLPDLLLTWVPYQWMEQVKLLILGVEIFEKVHSRPEIWSFEYEHSKLVKIGWGLSSLNGRSSASRGAAEILYIACQHATLILSPFGSLAKFHSRPEIWASKHKLWRKWVFFRVAFFKRPPWPQILKNLKNIIASLSYGRYRLVPNRGTFWQIFWLYVTFCGFHCFDFHMSLFLVISFQTPLKNPTRPTPSLRLCASDPSGRIFEGGYKRR